MPKIEDLRDERDVLKDQIETLKIKLNRVNKKLEAALAKQDGEAYTLPDGKKLQIVRGKNRTFNWRALEDSLDPQLWVKIQEPSKLKLDELIEDGEIPISFVAKHTIFTERMPFVREF